MAAHSRPRAPPRRTRCDCGQTREIAASDSALCLRKGIRKRLTVGEEIRLQGGMDGLATTRKTITKIAMRKDGTSEETEPRLVHNHCHHGHTTGDGNGPALLPAHEPSGLA